MKVLFVCSSNVCRSPYCEYVLRRLVKEDPDLNGKVEIKSSAVFNKMKNIFPKAIPSLIKEGYTEEEIKAHKPDYIWCNYKPFKEADIIIGMSRSHRFLLPVWLWKKYKPLSVAAGDKYHLVPDPFLYKTQEEYDECMGKIREYVVKYYNKIKEELR